MFKTRKRIINESGFTLVELMVTVFLTAIAVIAIYRGYTAFSQAADAQEQMLEMQQTLRIGMFILEKDIRRAGMNEENDENAGFEIATANRVRFTMDLTGGEADGKDNDNDGLKDALDLDDEKLYGDGDLLDAGERIEYQRKVNPDGTFGLYRNDVNAGTSVEIITNVSALDFVYLDENNEWIDPAAATTIPPAALAAGLALGDSLDTGQMDLLRAVQISLVVQTTNEDYRYTNNESYNNINPNGAVEILGPQNDNKRRRMLNKQVKIRNAGL